MILNIILLVCLCVSLYLQFKQPRLTHKLRAKILKIKADELDIEHTFDQTGICTFTHHGKRLSYQFINNNCGVLFLSGLRLPDYELNRSKFVQECTHQLLSYRDKSNLSAGKLLLCTIRDDNFAMKAFAKKLGFSQLITYNNLSGSANLGLWGLVGTKEYDRTL